MAKISKQANSDGTMVDDFDPPHPSAAMREEVLRTGFETRDWEILNISSDEGQRLVELQVSRGNQKYEIEAFVFPNLAYASRSVEEKRIQLTRNYEDHRESFALENNGERRCLLLGFYTRQNKTIICAWDARSYRDHSNPSSCYVRVPALCDAMRNGFGQSIDGKGRLVCCFQSDLLPFYVENMRDLHDRVVVNQNLISASLERAEEIASPQPVGELETNLPLQVNEIPSDLPRNRILYGAPGTGKSYRLESEIVEHFNSGELRERITFHPDYTYSQLVGSYRPVPLYREISDQVLTADKTTGFGKFEPLIDYQYVPGPFLRMLAKALANPSLNFVLVIEELNRANAPAVFGEVFQLLDRDESGLGKFEVSMPAEARDYLQSIGLSGSIRMPPNLYLWATMNSADQGVMPLDAAFKRRWSFQYVALNAEESVTSNWKIHLKFLNGYISWNTFRSAINNQLRQREVSEDRLLGPFFMRQDELASGEAFRNKLLLYLRDDVVRHGPEVLFSGASLSYGSLADAYDNGTRIFLDEIDFGPTIE